MRFAFPVVLSLLMVALLLVAAGCGSGESYITEEHANKVEAPLAPASHFQIIDIPAPALFKFDRKRSIISEKPEGRQATLIYKGRAHIERVANFYRDHMRGTPGWKLATDKMRGVRYVLEFTKGKDRCTVTIEPGSFGGVRVTIDIN